MPTTSEVNAAAANFITDTNTADAKINGPIADVTDRHGTVTKSLEKILSEIGYLNPVPFTSDITVSSGQTTVLYLGVIYAANPLSVPFTTTSSFNTSDWVEVPELNYRRSFSSRASASSAVIPESVNKIEVIHDEKTLLYVSQAGSTALTSNSGSRTWEPVGTKLVQHYGINTYPDEASALAAPSNTTALDGALAEGDLLADGWIHISGFVNAQSEGRLFFDAGDLAISGSGSYRGVKITKGHHDQPHAGGLGASTRPGDASQNIIAVQRVDETQANQQDSVLYIQGEALEPSAGSGLTTEYAGLRVNMFMNDGAEDGAGVRGVHANVTGDGGNAKLRAARLVAIGLDGHDGLVNGMTVTATRTGAIPTSAGGDGVQEYASGDAGPYPNEDSALAVAVGPGIRRAVVLEGQAGKERPQFGILQKFGNQAILPENAVMLLHGGGQGDLIAAARDETDAGDITSKWEKDGQIAAQGFRSNPDVITVADDAAVTIPLARNGGFISLYSPGSSARWAHFFFRAIAGAEVATNIAKGGSVDLTTGPLNGTTGTDGRLTVSIDDQNLIVENRQGASVQVNFTVT